MPTELVPQAKRLLENASHEQILDDDLRIQAQRDKTNWITGEKADSNADQLNKPEIRLTNSMMSKKLREKFAHLELSQLRGPARSCAGSRPRDWYTRVADRVRGEKDVLNEIPCQITLDASDAVQYCRYYYSYVYIAYCLLQE